MLELHLLGLLAARLHGGKVLFALDPDATQDADRVVLHLFDHFAEHIERFALVFLLRVLLCIRAQADALAQVVHGGQVLFPVEIELAQHDLLLDAAHEFGADVPGLLLVSLVDFFNAAFGNCLGR